MLSGLETPPSGSAPSLPESEESAAAALSRRCAEAVRLAGDRIQNLLTNGIDRDLAFLATCVGVPDILSVLTSKDSDSMPPIRLSYRERTSLAKLSEMPLHVGTLPPAHVERFLGLGFAEAEMLRVKITARGQIELLRQRFRKVPTQRWAWITSKNVLSIFEERFSDRPLLWPDPVLPSAAEGDAFDELEGLVARLIDEREDGSRMNGKSNGRANGNDAEHGESDPEDDEEHTYQHSPASRDFAEFVPAFETYAIQNGAEQFSRWEDADKDLNGHQASEEGDEREEDAEQPNDAHVADPFLHRRRIAAEEEDILELTSSEIRSPSRLDDEDERRHNGRTAPNGAVRRDDAVHASDEPREPGDRDAEKDEDGFRVHGGEHSERYVDRANGAEQRSGYPNGYANGHDRAYANGRGRAEENSDDLPSFLLRDVPIDRRSRPGVEFRPGASVESIDAYAFRSGQPEGGQTQKREEADHIGDGGDEHARSNGGINVQSIEREGDQDPGKRGDKQVYNHRRGYHKSKRRTVKPKKRHRRH